MSCLEDGTGSSSGAVDIRGQGWPSPIKYLVSSFAYHIIRKKYPIIYFSWTGPNRPRTILTNTKVSVKDTNPNDSIYLYMMCVIRLSSAFQRYFIKSIYMQNYFCIHTYLDYTDFPVSQTLQS